jgi:hypothetical protein
MCEIIISNNGDCGLLYCSMQRRLIGHEYPEFPEERFAIMHIEN